MKTFYQFLESKSSGVNPLTASKLYNSVKRSKNFLSFLHIAAKDGMFTDGHIILKLNDVLRHYFEEKYDKLVESGKVSGIGSANDRIKDSIDRHMSVSGGVKLSFDRMTDSNYSVKGHVLINSDSSSRACERVVSSEYYETFRNFYPSCEFYGFMEDNRFVLVRDGDDKVGLIMVLV